MSFGYNFIMKIYDTSQVSHPKEVVTWIERKQISEGELSGTPVSLFLLVVIFTFGTLTGSREKVSTMVWGGHFRSQ